MLHQPLLEQTLPQKVIASTAESPCLNLQLCDPDSSLRKAAEDFVQEIFDRSYGAMVYAFYPTLLSLTRQDNTFAAVAGIRSAELEPLFLENYLAAPIENILSVDRARIVEIGNLAPSNAGQARWLITIINAFMLGAGFTHVVFTGVPRLKNAFQRMGLPLTELAKATPDHLTEKERLCWGRYYDEKPLVLMGDLHAGEDSLSRIANSMVDLSIVCQRARMAGQIYRRQHAAKLNMIA